MLKNNNNFSTLQTKISLGLVTVLLANATSAMASYHPHSPGTPSFKLPSAARAAVGGATEGLGLNALHSIKNSSQKIFYSARYGTELGQKHYQAVEAVHAVRKQQAEIQDHLRRYDAAVAKGDTASKLKYWKKAVNAQAVLPSLTVRAQAKLKVAEDTFRPKELGKHKDQVVKKFILPTPADLKENGIELEDQHLYSSFSQERNKALRNKAIHASSKFAAAVGVGGAMGLWTSGLGGAVHVTRAVVGLGHDIRNIHAAAEKSGDFNLKETAPNKTLHAASAVANLCLDALEVGCSIASPMVHSKIIEGLVATSEMISSPVVLGQRTVTGISKLTGSFMNASKHL